MAYKFSLRHGVGCIVLHSLELLHIPDKLSSFAEVKMTIITPTTPMFPMLSRNAIYAPLKGKPRKNKPVPKLTRGVIVESSPRYVLSPLAPYRLQMVRPRAKFVVVLRDPTERCNGCTVHQMNGTLLGRTRTKH